MQGFYLDGVVHIFFAAGTQDGKGEQAKECGESFQSGPPGYNTSVGKGIDGDAQMQDFVCSELRRQSSVFSDFICPLIRKLANQYFKIKLIDSKSAHRYWLQEPVPAPCDRRPPCPMTATDN